MADGHSVTGSDPRVNAALADYLQRMDRGESLSVDDFLAQHVEIAGELRPLLIASEDLALLAPSHRPTESPPPEVSTSSVAEQNVETIVPQRVQSLAVTETLLQRLPETFGRYRIIRPLGSGAMGDVYLAEDSQLHRQVALKTPSFDQDQTGELLERFYREARSAAALRHSNICPVHDVGEINGRHYISMAYIEGQPLSAYIRPDKLQPERQALAVIRKLALALQEAHDKGIIHRDLKPGNVMIDRKGEPIVMDFGLARPVQSEAGARLTQSGMLVGSPAYMSPEQVEGDTAKLSPATDQYSLGVILYELLTGSPPFRGGVTALIAAILTKEPTPPSRLCPDLDPRIEALCLKMMAKSPRERFPSMRSIAEAIAGILKCNPVPASDKPVKSTETPAAPSTAKSKKSQRDEPPTAVPAAAAAVSITASNVESLLDAATRFMRRCDYEQVVQILDSIPEHKRNDQVRALVAKARELSDEVAFLLAEIDEAARLNDSETLGKKAEALLKLKPRHHKALQVKEELSRYGKARLWKAGGWTPDGRRIGEGSWIPWLPLSIFAGVFGVSLLLVMLYLRVGDAVVRVQIMSPDVEVGIQDRTLNIKSANQDIKVDPGEETLTVNFQGATFETEAFTLKKGENPAIVVELLGKTLAAKFGDVSIGEWQVEPHQTPVAAAVSGSDSSSTAWSPAVPLDLSAPMPENLLTLIIHTGAEGKRDLVIHTRSSTTSPWSAPTPLTELNTSYDDLSPCLSADGLTLIFESDRPGGQGLSDLWISRRTARTAPWSAAVNLGANVNSPGREGLATLSADGRTLIFASVRRGGVGMVDLWTSQRSSASASDWSPAALLDRTINTETMELAPLLTTDGLELFFTTDRPGGFGSVDLWVSRRAAPNDDWPEPQNLGSAANIQTFDYGHVLSPDGRLLIFSSSRSGDTNEHHLWVTRRGSR